PEKDISSSGIGNAYLGDPGGSTNFSPPISLLKVILNRGSEFKRLKSIQRRPLSNNSFFLSVKIMLSASSSFDAVRLIKVDVPSSFFLYLVLSNSFKMIIDSCILFVLAQASALIKYTSSVAI